MSGSVQIAKVGRADSDTTRQVRAMPSRAGYAPGARTPASRVSALPVRSPFGTRAGPAARPSASWPVVVQRTCGGGPGTGGCDCADCEKRDADGSVATKPVRGGRPPQFGHGALVPTIVREVVRSPGVPVPPSFREDCERGFGADLRDVRIHADARAHDAGRSIGARAYAVGNRFVFGRDAYAPGTADGRRLIAHELARVVQQGVTLCLPKMLSGQVRQRARTRAGCRRVGHAVGRSAG